MVEQRQATAGRDAGGQGSSGAKGRGGRRDERGDAAAAAAGADEVAASAACGLRPEIPRDCPPFLRSLMSRCWDNCPLKRPQFSEIISTLQKQSLR